MKIALINENSQCSKNEMIYNSLKKVAEKYGHEVLNFGTESYCAKYGNRILCCSDNIQSMGK